MTLAPGNFRFDIHTTHHSKLPQGKLLFEGGVRWRLYQKNGNYLVEYLKPRTKSTNFFCLFKKDFSKGTVYLTHPNQLGHLQPILQLVTSNLLPQHQGIMVHASGIVIKEKGYLFVGPSGAGKTTLANFWNKEKGVTVLNDERLIVRRKNSAFWLYGTPWNTTFSGCSSKSAPLKKVFFISHAKKNTLQKATSPAIFFDLFSQLFLPYWNPASVRKTFKICENVLTEIPTFRLGFVKDRCIIPFLKKQGVGRV